MGDSVAFLSREYFLFLALLACARGLDFLSTWIATPRLAMIRLIAMPPRA